MRKNLSLGVLVAILGVLVWTDTTVRTGADGWCAWWRTHVKVCSVNVEHVDRTEIDTVYYTNVLPTTGAVCTTDSDCAAWEVRNNVPYAERTFGAPVPAGRKGGR